EIHLEKERHRALAVPARRPGLARREPGRAAEVRGERIVAAALRGHDPGCPPALAEGRRLPRAADRVGEGPPVEGAIAPGHFEAALARDRVRAVLGEPDPSEREPPQRESTEM